MTIRIEGRPAYRPENQAVLFWPEECPNLPDDLVVEVNLPDTVFTGDAREVANYFSWVGMLIREKVDQRRQRLYRSQIRSTGDGR